VQEVYEYLKAAGTYWLATVEGDQPRVRPFGTQLIHDGKLYIQTSKTKPCSKQMAANPKVEISAMKTDGTWLRLEGKAVNDDSKAAKQAMLDEHPQLKDMYSVDDPNTQVLYIKDAVATFASFGGEPRVVKY